jgi:predicted site-specific integrase-resolvase
VEGWGKIKQGACYAGVSERTFRDWLKDGLVHSRLPSGTILIRYSAVDKFLERFTVDENEVDNIVAAIAGELNLGN